MRLYYISLVWNLNKHFFFCRLVCPPCDADGPLWCKWWCVLSQSSTKIFLPMMHSSDVLSDRAVLQFCKQIIAVQLPWLSASFCCCVLSRKLKARFSLQTHQTTDFGVRCLCHYSRAGVSLQLFLAFTTHTMFLRASDLLTTPITA